MKIHDKILNKYDAMSKSHKIISDFIMNNKNIVPFLSVTELSDKCSVSPSTITRYSKYLGFNGFLDFQRELKKEVTTGIVSFEELRNIDDESADEEMIFNAIVNSNIKALEEFNNKKNFIDLSDTVEMMIESDDIYILGSRSSMSVAYYLYFLLKSIRKNTFFINNDNYGFTKEIQSVDKDDLLIAISYSKYTKFTYKIAEYFKLKHSKVISISDSDKAPISNICDKTLVIKNGEESFSFVSTSTAINILISLYAKKANIGDKIYEEQDITSNFFDVYI